MADPAPRTRCSVCRHPKKSAIHALIASGMPYADIHTETQKLGLPVKRETIGKHVRLCLGGVKPTLDEATAQDISDESANARDQVSVDFAVMVQKRATELLKSGDLRVTAQHGLTAQALIDRRLEKQADRDLALNMARLLSGAIMMTPMTVIEGRAIDVTPELGDGLAPEGVYEPVDA
jgi:hypothetical protein